jgi:predicted nucleic acid-binding Zn ribbon protein
MKVQIKYPEAKCAYCGKPYKKKHNRQKYCSQECATNAHREHKRNWAYTYYHKNKNRINQTRIGTRTIGPKPNPDTKREAEIINNEIERIGLNIHF